MLNEAADVVEEPPAAFVGDILAPELNGAEDENGTLGDTPVWHRQPNEGARAYEAFRMYRDMGANRSQRETARLVGKSLTAVASFANKHDWTKRTTAFDFWEDQKRMERAERVRGEEMENFRQRRKNLSTAAHNVSVRMLAAIGRALTKMDTEHIEIEPKMIPQWARAAALVANAAALGESDALCIAEIKDLLGTGEV